MHTAKFLIGTTPGGVIVFISPAYPGCTTDKEIVAATGIVDQLNTGDNLMADKGFLIDDMLPEGRYFLCNEFYFPRKNCPLHVKTTDRKLCIIQSYYIYKAYN
jgi:hypothetical protein